MNHSLSRNASQCSDYFDSADEYHRPVYRQQQAYPPAPYPRFTTSASPSPYGGRSRSRSRSPSIERQPSTPILNVRLVGVDDRRGRTASRYHPEASSSKASDMTPTSSTFQNVSENPTHATAQNMSGLLILRHRSLFDKHRASCRWRA
ncbi:hypothetical protein H0H93_003208 [Arthromyces matolae]|nr:hypothetical protein H0H93_003208 [Arthromyces matolae]